MSCECNNIINLVSGDRKPDIYIQITDKKTDNTVNLSDAGTIGKFRFRKAGTTTTLFEVTLVKLNSGTAGEFKMEWPANSLDNLLGPYEGEVSIEYSGLPETLYDVIQFNIRTRFASV